MKSKIDEVKNLQKIAGILKEDDDFDLSFNPLSNPRLKDQYLSSRDIEHIEGNLYKIKRPDGKEVEVHFTDYDIEEMVDYYSGYGWIRGEDDDGHIYEMDADFTEEGGGGYYMEPRYDTLQFRVQ